MSTVSWNVAFLPPAKSANAPTVVAETPPRGAESDAVDQVPVVDQRGPLTQANSNFSTVVKPREPADWDGSDHGFEPAPFGDFGRGR